MAVKEIDARGVQQMLRATRKLFVQGMSGEPRALHAIVRDDPSIMSHVSVLTSFVAGINRFDCDLLKKASEVSGFFPAPAMGRENYRQIISSYFGVTDSVRDFAADTVFIPVSPPNKDGMVTPGLSAEFIEASLDAASRRIAIISHALPVLAHNAFVPFERFTHSFVDDTEPLSLPVASAGPDPVFDAITDHLARLIDDGATLQTGIGRVPGKLFSKLIRHRKLRIHSGLISSEIRTLVEAGALDRDIPMRCATLTGDPDFYHWLNGQKNFRLHPIQHTHSPATLAKIDGLVTVNSAVEVDLLGQVNAEKAGEQCISAAGGLPDFSAAGHRSADGCSIIALPATDTSGTRSRIVTRLSSDAPITVPRTDVDFVVTEYGIAELRDKTPDERARTLASIAAPDARRALKRYS